MEISIDFKVLWDSLGEKSLPEEKELGLKRCIHSGNAGDIIYSLPTVIELGANHYVINLCSDPGFGGRNIDFSTARALAPLLLVQPYIKRVTIVSSNLPLEFLDQPIESIDYILDRFRLHEPWKHHLAICHAMAFGLHLNLYEKWLHLDMEKPGKDYIVLCLTPRFGSLLKEHWQEALSGLDNVIAIGIPQEFHCIAGIAADFVTCSDFLEMAKMIQGCRLFIGNQNLPYAIAEGLKVPRIVELFKEWPNAYPIGRSGYIAPSSIKEARDLIYRLISDSPISGLEYQNMTLSHKAIDLEATIREKDLHTLSLEAIVKDKDTHIGNLERQREENYRDWQTQEKNLRDIIQDKQTHIENLERQRDKNLQNWQTHVKNLERMLQEGEENIKNLAAVLRDKESHIGNLERQREENYRDWQAHAKNLELIIEEKDAHISNLETAARDKDAHISNLVTAARDKDAHISNLVAAARDKDVHISNLEVSLRDKDGQIGDLEDTLKQKQGTLNYIYNSYGLGALLVCNKMVNKLFPLNSKRRLFAKIILNGIRNPKYVLKNLTLRNLKIFAHHAKNVRPAILEERAETLIFQQAILMHCDKALLGPGNIEVAGWAISPHGIDKVEVHCDNRLLGNASYGSLRPDVQAVYPFIKNSDKSGFAFYADFARTQPSTEKYPIRVRAIAKDGKIGEVGLFLDELELYKNYLKRRTPNEATLHWMREISARLSVKPSISLVLIAREETLPLLARSLEALMAQAYPFWDILLFYEKELPVDILQKIHPLMDENKLKCYPLSEKGVSFNMIQGDFLGFIRPGDVLAPHTLFEMVKKINTEGTLDLIYTDEDTLIDGDRKDFFFKPDWSPDLLVSMNYVGQFFLLSRELFVQAGGLHYGFSSEGIYDLLLRVAERTKKIGHIPSVLCTKSRSPEHSFQAGKKVIEESLSRQGVQGEVIPLTEKGTSYRVKREIIGNPKVSIIILTAYKKPDLLTNCLKSIVEKSSYNNYEIILIDHSFGKLSQKDLEQLLPATAFKVIKYMGNFNFSRMNNLGTENATGDYFILLNDDTEVISPGWVEAMLEYAQHPQVGAVGVKLFYSDEMIQHGGVFLTDTGGGARHAFRFFLKDSEGYRGFLKMVRNCSAVTFACVMIPRKVFLEFKGLDENLKVECNDVDFCLRVNEAGYRVVWTPFALLYHRELATREKINFEDDISFFWNRWQHLLEKGDPYYNSNLTLDSDDFSLNPRPVIIEHHEPYLPRGSQITYHKNSFVDPESIHNILVVKLDHIGDVILSLPAIKMLQTRFPKAHITMLIGKWAKPIVEKFSQIDDILTFDFFFEESEKGKRKLTTKEIKHLRTMLQSHNFDLAIDLRRHHETREILKLSGARYMVGYCTGGDDDWLTTSLRLSEEIQDIATQSGKPHIAAQLCQLVQSITTNHSSTESPIIPIPRLSLEKELYDVKRYSQLLQAKFLVGIHPFAGSSIRQWPIPYLARLADILIERNNAQVVLFGGKGDKKSASEMVTQIRANEKVVSLVGDISLDEFMSMVRLCHLFIGNISGPCHIAGVLGTPTLAVFGGQVLPHEWHPLGEKTLSIRLDVPCSPCYKAYVEQCPFDLKCMKFLWPERVYEAALQLITIARNPISQCAPLTQTKAYVPLQGEDHLIPPSERNFVGDGDFRKIGEHFLKHFISLAGLKPDERVLDVGCGIGRMAIPLTKYLNKHGSYEGFDVVQDGINWCRENISPRYPNFHFQIADLFNTSYNPHGKHKAADYRFPYEKEYFDFVFLTSVFTHMLPKDMENYLREISRVLRKNGRCFITFFLLNNESRKQIRDGKSTQNFRYTFKHNKEEYLTIDKANPEAAVAFDERFVRDLYERTNLVIVEPIYYGSWCGRSDFLDYQDIIIAHKKKGH